VRTLVLKKYLEGPIKRDSVFIPFQAMFGLLHGSVFREGESVRIAVMSGDKSSGCGKSSLLRSFISKQFIEGYDPTIEDSFRHSLVVDDKSQVLDIVDTVDYAPLHDQWIQDTQLVVICSTFDKEGQMDGVESLYEKIARVKDVDKPLVVIVRCKSDLDLPVVVRP